jgi:hypothetical protein
VAHTCNPATQEAEIRRIMVQSQSGQIVCETLSQKYQTRKGLVEWLKVKDLSSSPSTAKKKKSRKISAMDLFFTFKDILFQKNSQ